MKESNITSKFHVTLVVLYSSFDCCTLHAVQNKPLPTVILHTDDICWFVNWSTFFLSRNALLAGSRNNSVTSGNNKGCSRHI